MEKTVSVRDFFILGTKSGLPVAIGYLPVAVAFGLLAANAGYGGMPAVAMSLIIFAGASQFVAINLLSLGVAPIVLIITTLMLNFRHFIMSASLSQRMEKCLDRRLIALMAFGVTDETFAVAMFSKQEKVTVWYGIGLNLVAYIAWVLGTVLGIAAGGFIPEVIAVGLNISLYAMFIGLLVPNLKGSVQLSVVAAIATVISCVLSFTSLSKGLIVILTTLAASMAGAAIFRQEAGE